MTQPCNSTAPEEKCVWMKSLVFKNTQFMHLQNRNVYGRVFGGWIMRTALELGWVAAACYMGEKNARFIFVDDIQFVKVRRSPCFSSLELTSEFFHA